MSPETPQMSFLPFILITFITGLILIVPIWKIFGKTGKDKAWALLIFLPFPLGLWVVSLVLAFSHWPASKIEN